MSTIPKTSTDWTPNVILLETREVGRHVADHVNRTLSDHKSPVMVEGRDFKCDNYYRDLYTTLLDGTTIIPFIGKNIWNKQNHPFWEEHISALLPHQTHLFLESIGTVAYGTSLASDLYNPELYPGTGTQTKRGKCAIEGANCFIVNTKTGCKALIAHGGLIATRVALEYQGYYQAHRKTVKILANSVGSRLDSLDDYYYQARNATHFAILVRGCASLDSSAIQNAEAAFYRLIAKPLTPQDKEDYRLQAHTEAAKIFLAKREISREYNIPLKNMAFVPNFECHLDYTYTVLASEGVVLLHDDSEVVKLYPDTPFAKTARTNIAHGSQQLIRQAAKEIHQVGMQVILIAGMFESEDVSHNMMNGLFVEGENETIFFTNDTSLKKDDQGNCLPTDIELQDSFAKHFLQKVHNVLPKRTFRVVYTNTGQALKERDAGLHCYTIEKGKPLKTVQSRLVTDAQDLRVVTDQYSRWRTYYQNKYMDPLYLQTMQYIHTALTKRSSDSCDIVVAEDENQELQGIALMRKGASTVTIVRMITAPFNQPYIDPTHRNRMHGVGSSLVQCIARAAKRASLSFEVASPKHLTHFFRKNGFARLAQQKGPQVHMTWVGQTDERKDRKSSDIVLL